MRSRKLNGAIWAALLIVVSPLAAPELLVFPYHAAIGQHRVYSQHPIDAKLREIVTRADRLVVRSGIAGARAPDQRIFLTDGGWRWRWLSFSHGSAFALSRPVVETIVLNRADIGCDLVLNGQALAGQRSLHGTIAHEMVHGLIRAHFGLFADWRYPAELREGYADHVAGGGSLSDDQARALHRAGGTVPALLYWRGRKRVESELRVNGGSVEALFREWR